MNIIDPLFSGNNLGKSINYYNFTKIQKVLEIQHLEMNKLKEIYGSGLCSYKNSKNLNTPINYLNSLMKIFSRSLSMCYHELFFFSISRPKIFLVQDGLQVDDIKTLIQKEEATTIKEHMVDEFNLKFKISKGVNFFDSKFEECTKKEKEEESKHQINTNGSIYITKEIMYTFIEQLENGGVIKVFKNYNTDKTNIELITSLIKQS